MDEIGQARTERSCPDPACAWKVIEPLHQPADSPMPWAPWAGSIQATLANAVERIAADHWRLIEAACEAHIREYHDAEDPIGWAERTVANERAKAERVALPDR